MQGTIEKKDLIQWINQQDFFYVKDIFVVFELQRTEPASLSEQLVAKTLSDLRKCGHIQAGGKNKSSVQYFLISSIPTDYVLIDRIKKELVKCSFSDCKENVDLIKKSCNEKTRTQSVFCQIKINKDKLTK